MIRTWCFLVCVLGTAPVVAGDSPALKFCVPSDVEEVAVARGSGAIAFVRAMKGKPSELVWRPGLVTSESDRVTSLRVGTSPNAKLAISDDGRTVFYLRPSEGSPMSALVFGTWNVGDEDVAEVPNLVPDGEGMASVEPLGVGGIAVNQDGERVAFSAVGREPAGATSVICVWSARSKKASLWRAEDAIKQGDWSTLLGWDDAGSGVLLQVGRNVGGGGDIWRISPSETKKVGTVQGTVTSVLKDGRIVVRRPEEGMDTLRAFMLREGEVLAGNDGRADRICVAKPGEPIVRLFEVGNGFLALRKEEEPRADSTSAGRSETGVPVRKKATREPGRVCLSQLAP